MQTKWTLAGIVSIAVAIGMLVFLMRNYIYSDKEYNEALNLVGTNKQVADIFGVPFSVERNDIAEVLRMDSKDGSFRTYTYGFDVHGSKKNGNLLVRIVEGTSQWKLQINESDGKQEKLLFERIENKTSD